MPDLWDFDRGKMEFSLSTGGNLWYTVNIKGVMTMSVDVLQNKIRKKKNPCALVIAPTADQIPPSFLSAFDDPAMAAGEYCGALLQALAPVMAAVRFDFGAFALMGPMGLTVLRTLLEQAAALGYYVLIDWLRLETPAGAEAAAKQIFGGSWPCDGAVVCAYGGVECVKPWLNAAGSEKDVFAVLKTANKSGAQLQDLQPGGRVVYSAAADLVSRWGETAVGRCGYSRVGGMAGANNAAALKNLRQNYPRMFLLVDGLDAPGANAKNASAAFDKMGYGALCCEGSGIFAAWQEGEGETDPVAAALDAAERMKRNVTRYVTVL